MVTPKKPIETYHFFLGAELQYQNAKSKTGLDAINMGII